MILSWKIGSGVKVGLAFGCIWLASACALYSQALDFLGEFSLSSKKELMVVTILILSCLGPMKLSSAIRIADDTYSSVLCTKEDASTRIQQQLTGG
jgi:hypothetical protein